MLRKLDKIEDNHKLLLLVRWRFARHSDW